MLEWVAISFSRGSSRLRDPTCIGRQILYHWATYEAHNSVYKEIKGYSWLTYISRICFLQGGEGWTGWQPMGTGVVLMKSLAICKPEANKPMLGGLRMIPRVTWLIHGMAWTGILVPVRPLCYPTRNLQVVFEWLCIELRSGASEAHLGLELLSPQAQPNSHFQSWSWESCVQALWLGERKEKEKQSKIRRGKSHKQVK